MVAVPAMDANPPSSRLSLSQWPVQVLATPVHPLSSTDIYCPAHPYLASLSGTSRRVLPPTSHLLHVSDADQAEALLTRWGPRQFGR